MTRFPHRAVPIVLGAVLVDTIGFGIVMPVLPRLITRLGNVDLEQATRIGGYMLVVFALFQFVAGPILGNLSDRYGRRPVLMVSMAAFAVDYALMAAAPSLAWLFVGRAVAGATGAVYAPASAAIADVTPPDRRAGTFALIGAAFGTGFILGPALGGLIAGWGERAPFVVAAGLALANALAMAFLLPETLSDENRRPFAMRDAHIAAAFGPLWRAGNAAPLLVAWFLWQLAHNVYPATWSFWGAIRFGWGPQAIGASLAGAGLTMVLVQAGLTGRVIRRFGERRAIVVGLGAGAAAFLLFSVATSIWQVCALFIVGSLSGFVFPAMNGLLSRLTPPDRQGALQGGVGAMQSVSSIIGPLLLSQALATGVDRGWPGGAFLIAGLLAAAALAIVVAKVLGRVAPAPAAPHLAAE